MHRGLQRQCGRSLWAGLTYMTLDAASFVEAVVTLLILPCSLQHALATCTMLVHDCLEYVAHACALG